MSRSPGRSRQFMATRIAIDRSRNIFNCPKCKRSFITEESLLQHCRNTSRHSWCEECRQICRTDSDLQIHLKYKIVHRTCHICSRVFMSSDNLKTHLITHKVANIECLFCNREFRTFSSMLIHLEASNCVKEGYVDHWFGKFADWSDLSVAQTPYGTSDYECKNCGRLFTYVSGLFQHIERACIANKDVAKKFEDFLKECESGETVGGLSGMHSVILDV